MVFFMKLPQELQYPILEPLSYPDLRALCLVNKAFRIWAQPSLYTHLRMETRLRPERLKIGLLLRTLICRPEFGRYAQSLHLKELSFGLLKQYSSTVPPPPPKIEVDMDKATQFIKGTPVPDTDDWVSQLEYTTDAQLALLLSLMPNLKSLRLSFGFETKILCSMFKTALTQSPGTTPVLPKFDRLQEVFLSDSMHEFALMMFHLPQIKTISVFIENKENFTWPIQMSNLSGVKSLDLTKIREQRLGILLSAVKELETLTWNCIFHNGYDDPINNPTINLDEVTKAVLCTRETLTNLTINMFNLYRPFMQARPDLSIQGSLKELKTFPKLKELSVPWSFIVRPEYSSCRLVDVIPASIEFLQVSGGTAYRRKKADDFLPVIQTWLDEDVALFPNLTTISLYYLSTFTLVSGWRDTIRSLKSSNPIAIEVRTTGRGNGIKPFRVLLGPTQQ